MAAQLAASANRAMAGAETKVQEYAMGKQSEVAAAAAAAAAETISKALVRLESTMVGLRVFWISSKCFTSSHNYENCANLKRTI